GSHAGDAAGVMRPKIVVYRDGAIVLGGGDQPLVVGTLIVALVIRFLDRTPLHGHVVCVVQVDDLVVAPAQGQVVKYDVVRAGPGGPQPAELDAVATRADVAPATDAEVANDDVVGAVIVARNDALDRDAGARGGLTGDRDVGPGDANVTSNDPADVEDDDPRPVRSTGFRQAARSGGVVIGHLDDSAAPPALARRPPTLGAREGLQGGGIRGNFRRETACS